MKSKQLQPIWSDKHKEYMQRAKEATISVAEGAVRAGKTVDNCAVFARMIDLGVRDRIHLATGSTSANAKLNIGDCNGFGLEHIFRGRCHWTKYKGNEALIITNSQKREYVVIFAGAAKADSYKKIRGNSYGMWIATEINLHHDNTIHEAFNRQLAAKTRKVLWDLNPSSPAASIYVDYIDKFAKAYGDKYNYQHFTIRDNATVTPERLAEIEAQYDPKSIWYKRDILGERCNVEGLIYGMFDKEKHVKELTTEGDYYVSSDFGIQNATVFLLWRRVSGSSYKWQCIREYYYSGRDEHRELTVGELVDGLQTMLAGVYPKQIIIDPSAAALIVELRKRGYKTREAVNTVRDGISDVATMLRGENLYFSPQCEHTIAEFGLYMWDEKAADEGEDVPLKVNDHAMDAIRYFVKTLGLVRRANKVENLSRVSSVRPECRFTR